MASAVSVGSVAELFEHQGDEAQGRQVEADHEQVVDRVGEVFLALEDLDEKDAAVAVQRPADEQCDRHADRQVGEVRRDYGIH